MSNRTKIVAYLISGVVWISALCVCVPAGLKFEAQNYMEAEEVQNLNQEIERIKEHRRVFETTALELMDENEQLRNENAQLREQLVSLRN